MEDEFVYRISTAKEWELLQSNGSMFGGDLDKSSGFIHLSKLNQVRSTLENFFTNTKLELYLLQIDAKKLGDGLIYEGVDATNTFPHFYGPSRSFAPLPLDAVTKAEKLCLSDVTKHMEQRFREYTTNSTIVFLRHMSSGAFCIGQKSLVRY